MTRSETVRLMQIIIVMYPGSKIRADELTVGVWHEMLSDLPGEAVSAAVKRMCATLAYPPSIADVRKAVSEAVKDAQGILTAGEAWAKVNRAMRLYGYYRAEDARKFLGETIWRAVMAVGGWTDLCVSEEPAVLSAQFERRYNDMLGQQLKAVQIPASVSEQFERIVGPLVKKLNLTDGARAQADEPGADFERMLIITSGLPGDGVPGGEGA